MRRLTPIDQYAVALDDLGNTIVTLSFSGSLTRDNGTTITNGALIDGYFELNVDPAKVRRTGTTIDLDGDANGVAGGEYVFGDTVEDKFFSLYGDFTGDTNVNVIDLLKLRESYNSREGDERYMPMVDFDSNGYINVFELLQFRQRYNTGVTFE